MPSWPVEVCSHFTNSENAEPESSLLQNYCKNSNSTRMCDCHSKGQFGTSLQFLQPLFMRHSEGSRCCSRSLTLRMKHRDTTTDVATTWESTFILRKKKNYTGSPQECSDNSLQTKTVPLNIPYLSCIPTMT